MNNLINMRGSPQNIWLRKSGDCHWDWNRFDGAKGRICGGDRERPFFRQIPHCYIFSQAWINLQAEKVTIDGTDLSKTESTQAANFSAEEKGSGVQSTT